MAVKNTQLALLVALALQQMSQQGYAQTVANKKTESSLPEVAVQANKDVGMPP